MKELVTRWAYPAFENSIPDDFSIDQSSRFGASKRAADIEVQEYGHYFDMSTYCLREGYVTGPNHSGVSCSILEAFDLTEKIAGLAQKYAYLEENRSGDRICYYNDLRKMRAHYPNLDITKSLEETIREIVASWRERQV